MLIVLITVTIIIAIYLTVKIKSIKVVIANYIKQDWREREDDLKRI